METTKLALWDLQRISWAFPFDRNMAHFLCYVNLIIEPKEKGGSGREERRMRRSCRYRRRRSHSLCRDVRGVGGCTLHRWTTLLHSGGGEHLQGKPLPRVYTSSPLLLLCLCSPGDLVADRGTFFAAHSQGAAVEASSELVHIFRENISSENIGPRKEPSRKTQLALSMRAVQGSNNKWHHFGKRSSNHFCEWYRISNEDGISPQWYMGSVWPFKEIPAEDFEQPRLPCTTLHN